MRTARAAKAARAEGSRGKVQAPAGTVRALPDDLTVTIGLLIKKEYEQKIAELEARVSELEDASVTDVQDVMWEELGNVHLVEKPFAATKELLASKEDWLTLDMLFDASMLMHLGPRQKEAEIYEYLVKDLADDPRGFMNRIFRYDPSDSDGEEEDYED